MALKAYLIQNRNDDSTAYGKWFAYADNEKPIDLVGLAKHMSQHNTPFSEGTITGIIRDMVKCIRELNLNGQPVKIDNLAIFSAHIQNKNGWNELSEVDLTIPGRSPSGFPRGIQAIKQCAQATGDFTKAELTKYGSVILNREWRQKVWDAKHPEESGGGDGNG